MRRLIVVFLLTFCALPAAAESCRAYVNGSEVVVDAENFDTFRETVKRRERLLNWPSKTWNRTLGAPVACNSGVLFDYLASTVPVEDIDGYCLTNSTEAGYFLIPGPRNFRGMCRKTLCEKVNATVEETRDITAALASSALESATDPDARRAVAHKSGAFILSGSAASLGTTLSSAGTGVMTALSTPGVLAAAGVTVVAAGGAVYICSR